MAGATLISQFDYQNDALGRRTDRIDSGGATATNSFAYDSCSQLTNALMGADAFGWIFDPIGNRVMDTSNSITHFYAPNNLNQYTQITNGGVRTLYHDSDGNLTNDSVFVYSWDGENRLIQVEPLSATSGSNRVRCRYDYMSRRFEKAVDTWNGSAWRPLPPTVFCGTAG